MTKYNMMDALLTLKLELAQKALQAVWPPNTKFPGRCGMLGYTAGPSHTQWFWRHSQGYDLAIQSVVVNGKRQLEKQPIVTNDAESIALMRAIEAVNCLLATRRLPTDFFQVQTVSRYEPLDWLYIKPRGMRKCKIGGALVVASLPQQAARLLLEVVSQSPKREAFFRYPTQQWVLDNGTIVDLPHGAPKYEDPNDSGQSGAPVDAYVNGRGVQVLSYDFAQDVYHVQFIDNGQTVMVTTHELSHS